MQIPNVGTFARLDRLATAIGEDDFGQHLMATARAAGEADHVMAFAFSGHQPPRAVISVGSLNEKKATKASALYAGSLYLLDPNYAEVRRIGEGEGAWFDFSSDPPCDHFREGFFDACGISDVAAFASRQAKAVYYVMFLRGEGGRFAQGQRWLLAQLGEVIAANLHKHFSYMHALSGQNQFVIDRVLAEAPSFAALTPRERRVCLGILTGYTSESIAINLEISINSVLTYRKRLYEKLGISSQNELFVKIIGAMVELGSDSGLSASNDPSANPIDARSGRAEKFDEYYMAEAFLADDML